MINTELSIKEKMADLEKEINSEKLQQDMIRKVKTYRNDYRNYLKDAEVTDALKVGKDVDGGYLVPDEMEKGIVEALADHNVVRKLATVFTTNRTLRVPGPGNKPVAVWEEEGGELSFSDMDFYQVVIDAHKDGYTVKVTEELLDDSGFFVEKYIIDSSGQSIGELEEEAFVNGDGVHKPRGFLQDAEVGVEVTELNSDALIDLYASVRAPYQKKGAWIISDEVANQLSRMKYANGRRIWEPDLTKKTPGMLLGKPVFVTKAMPGILPGNSVIAFGDFSYYLIGDRGKRAVKRLNELYAANGEIGFRVTHRVDGKLALPEAVKTLKIVA